MTVIKIKNSNVTGRLPSSGDIEIAELALNIADKKLYSKDAAGAIFEIGVSGDLPSGPNPPNSGNNVGDLFFDTTEGNLVYWDGSAWIPLPGDADGEGFVKVSGDNMTGNLTLGTDKITLDATDGTAEFADGFIALKKDQPTFAISSRFVIANASDSNNTVANISNVGSAEFAGEVYSKSYLRSDSFLTVNKTAGNLIRLGDSIGGTQYGYYSTAGDGTTVKAGIGLDGSATFAGSVSATTTPTRAGIYIQPDSTNTNNVALRVISGNSGTASILEDGSAEFAGTITTATYDLTNSSGSGVHTTTGGSVIVQRADIGGRVFQGFNGTTELSTIFANGSATFKGVVQSENADGSTFSYMSSNGSIGGTGNIQMGTYMKLGQDKCVLNENGDGSAEFAGSVKVGEYNKPSTNPTGEAFQGYNNSSVQSTYWAQNNSSDADAKVWLGYDSGDNATSTIKSNGSAEFANSAAGAYTYISSRPAATSFCISGGSTDALSPTWYVTPAGNATFTTVNGASVLIQTEADDDTKYTTTTDSEGNETRVYNGAVLDVKETLQTALTTIADLQARIAVLEAA